MISNKKETIEPFQVKKEPRFRVQYDDKTVFTVRKHQLFRPMWIEFFGGVDKVKEFIIKNEK